MSFLQIHQFICRSDNYGVLIHDPDSGATASIDAPEASAVARELARRGWRLSHIFTTHHHGDHVEGNIELKDKTGCRITGPQGEADRIPGLDETVSGGARFLFAGREVRVFACPGHTKGHIAYYIPADSLLFAGDTLFAMGCGRVLEGTFGEMWQSVNQFRSLPPETAIYCGHEYTEANGKFALSVEPGNADLQARARQVAAQRRNGEMTCPTTLAEELKTNPFLRPGSVEIRSRLGLPDASDAEVFAELRRRKDNFR